MSQLEAHFSDEVCLVGNASSLLDKKLGPQIDQSQTVVRLNRGFPKHPDSQGVRTDLVGLSCPISRWKYRWHFKQTPIIWMTERRDIIPKWMQASDNFYLYPMASWQRLSEKLGGKRPSTGVMMVDLICHHIKPEKLRLVGFDFKRSATLFEKQDKPGPHDWLAERLFVQEIIKKAQGNSMDWAIYE